MAFTVLGWIFRLAANLVMSKGQVVKTLHVDERESGAVHVRR